MIVDKKSISVVGLGFVGTTLAVTNAKTGFNTIGVDIDDKRIECLKSGELGFFEPQMEKMLKHAIKEKKLCITFDIDYAIQNTNITFLTVGTPLTNNDNEVDLSYVKSAIKQIALSLKDKKTFHLLVVKSTLPPLSTEKIILPVFKNLINDGMMDVVVNPEFLREGFAVEDILKPHLIVIGSSNIQSANILAEYYATFYDTLPEIIYTTVSTAELIKYANNALLATKVSFINSISTLCQSIPGSDVNIVSYAIGKDPRIGPQFLQAGPGFGGSCLPKDLVGMIKVLHDAGKKADLFKAVKEINDMQFLNILELMKEQDILVKNNTVAVLGLSFKKNTSDVRNAASVKVVGELLKHGLNVRVHDPAALKNFKKIFGAQVLYFDSIHECLGDADCCIILTDWQEYEKLRPPDFIKHMRTSNIIDARRVLNAKKFQGMGFKAIGLGCVA